MILLDSDILIDMFREYDPALEWLESAGNEEIAVPGYCAMELIQGCHSKEAVRETAAELANYRMVWLTTEAAERAYELYCDLRPRQGLDMLDALIAQTARMLNVPLHTFNVKHFRSVPGLEIVQPYRKGII